MSRNIIGIAMLLGVAVGSSVAQPIMYVDVDAPTLGMTGDDWAHPRNDLSAVLEDVYVDGTYTEIRLGAGTYKPTTANIDPRAATFFLISGVAIKGGYAGYGSGSPDTRDIGLYVSILSGDIGTANVSSDNCYHVVTGVDPGNSPVNSLAQLDGVTVCCGYEQPVGYGAGVLIPMGSKPQILNCTIVNNTAPDGGLGGGIFVEGDGSGNEDIVIENTLIFSNYASYGGGIAIRDASPSLTDCVISYNESDHSGGGVNIWSNFDVSAAQFRNCVISGNVAETVGGGLERGGGGVYCDGLWVGAENNRPLFRDCTFLANYSLGGPGGGVTCLHANATFIKCAIESNLSFPRTGDPGGFGGGMAIDFGGHIIDCVFAHNATLDSEWEYTGLGGGLCVGKFLPTLVNTRFNGNFSGLGGGMYAFGQESPFQPFDEGVFLGTNCTFSSNSATVAGGGFASGGPSTSSLQAFVNSIFWNNFIDLDPGSAEDVEAQIYVPFTYLSNLSVTYSCIQDDGPGGSVPFGGFPNIDQDPRFRSPTTDNYRLKRCSPAIDVANTPAIPEDVLNINAPDPFTNCGDCATGERTPDLDLRARVIDETTTADGGIADLDCLRSCELVADLGAYEFGALPCDVMGDLNGDDVVNGGDIQPFTRCATGGQSTGYCACGDMNGNGVTDADDLACLIAKILTGESECDGMVICEDDYAFASSSYASGGGDGENAGKTMTWASMAAAGVAAATSEAALQDDPSGPGGVDGFTLAVRWIAFENWVTTHSIENYPSMSQSTYDAWASLQLKRIVLNGDHH